MAPQYPGSLSAHLGSHLGSHEAPEQHLYEMVSPQPQRRHNTLGRHHGKPCYDLTQYASGALSLSHRHQGHRRAPREEQRRHMQVTQGRQGPKTQLAPPGPPEDHIYASVTSPVV